MQSADLWQSIRADLYMLGQSTVVLAPGGALSWEREMARKWAGRRTHLLICLAAMLSVKVGQLVIMDAQALLSPGTLRTGPLRIIEAIVTGVAFLAAGTVFRDPDLSRARGLTTAVSLLVVAPVAWPWRSSVMCWWSARHCWRCSCCG